MYSITEVGRSGTSAVCLSLSFNSPISFRISFEEAALSNEIISSKECFPDFFLEPKYTLEAKSISGKRDILGSVRREINPRIIKHHASEMALPTINECKVIGEM